MPFEASAKKGRPTIRKTLGACVLQNAVRHGACFGLGYGEVLVRDRAVPDLMIVLAMSDELAFGLREELDDVAILARPH